jgi:hypothetical protein
MERKMVGRAKMNEGNKTIKTYPNLQSIEIEEA